MTGQLTGIDYLPRTLYSRFSNDFPAIDMRGVTVWTSIAELTENEAYAWVAHRVGTTHAIDRIQLATGKDGTTFVAATLRFVGMP